MPESLNAQIQEIATTDLGFDQCRFTSPWLPESSQAYRQQWLNDGHAGDMDYLVRHEALKADPSELLPGVQSAIVLSKSYQNTDTTQQTGDFRVARYAVGQDYHQVIGKRLREFEERLQILLPGIGCYSGIDSRPIAERDLALQAGLGFRGRNSMIITPGIGSYYFIAIVLTTAELASDAPSTVNCGSCTACVDACPTDVIDLQGGFDAAKCISYTTIEKKSPMSPSERTAAGDWIFGCDICQEVCPFNKEGYPHTDWTEFHPASGIGFSMFTQASESGTAPRIPRNTPLYRSRKRVLANFDARQK